MQSIHLPSSRALQLSSELIATLPVGLAGLYNPWAERCLYDAEGNGPEQRLERLAQHLDCSPRFVMLGEHRAMPAAVIPASHSRPNAW